MTSGFPAHLREDILGQPRHLLVLKLTCLFLLFRGYGDEPYLFPFNLFFAMLCMAMLVSPTLLTQRLLWGSLALSLLYLIARHWHFTDNHQYLMLYWFLVCALALSTDRTDELLSWNSRLLLSLAFGLATLWKLLEGEYLNGSFFHIVFLEGHELRGIGGFLGGLLPRTAHENLAIVQYLNLLPPGAVTATLTTTSGVRFVSLLASYFALLIEAGICLSLLCRLAGKPRWLAEASDYLLLIFIVSTFSFAQVTRFASLLAIMGFAQCSQERPRLRLAYIAVYFYVFVSNHVHFHFLRGGFQWAL